MLKQTKRSWQLYNNLTILDYTDASRTSKRISKGKLSTKRLTKDANESVADQTQVDLDEDESQSRLSVNENHFEGLVEESLHVYNDYQLDIWFLISEHIPPEDVGRFALICQKTRYIVSTAKFWFYLYRKYFDKKVELPTRLQPGCMVRLGGLRGCVIRSLFYMYPPFVQRTRTSIELDNLLKFKCTAVWYGRLKDYWTLCFKFSKRTRPNRSTTDIVDDWSSNEEFISAHTDIMENAEEGNRLLVVVTDRFYPPPEFTSSGMYLSKIIQPLSQNLRTFKLEMKFTEYNGRPVGNVSYDPVKQCKVLPWWEPEYYTHLS